MKKLQLIISALLVLICLTSCTSEMQSEPTTAAPELYKTDVNGHYVPAFNDVNASVLDPSLFVKDADGRMRYSDASVSTYSGIDVSVFQGDIDWDAVRADGIDFVMLRVGYRGYGQKGILGEDEAFRKNASAARQAGLEVGAYFFSQATNADEAREEALFALNVIRDCELTYPVAFDWEIIDYDTARTDGMTADRITACAEAFCQTVAAAGYEPLIYFNCEVGYFNYDLSRLKDIHFWLAEYGDIPSFYYDYKIWQYSKTGSVSGINGEVDLNICLCDYAGTASVG